jgi:hypothetical protein
MYIEIFFFQPGKASLSSLLEGLDQQFICLFPPRGGAGARGLLLPGQGYYDRIACMGTLLFP